MTKIIKKQIKSFEYREKNITRFLFLSFVVLLVGYGILVNSTMANAVRRQVLSEEIASLNSEINSMEFEYLNNKNSITMDLAIKEGFVIVKNQNFVSVSPSTNSLSLSNNEN